MKKNWVISLIALIVLALMVSLAGCTPAGPTGGDAGNNGPGKSQKQQTSQTNQTAGSDTITAEEAQTIALEHAGLTADQVTGLRANFDRDDGIPEYEVEFRQDRWEYEYEIHAETGEILSWDKDD